MRVFQVKDNDLSNEIISAAVFSFLKHGTRCGAGIRYLWNHTLS